MLDGPSSRKRPVREEQPGPPFSHRTTGSFLGSFRDSKNPMQALSASYEESNGMESLTVKEVLILILVIEVTAELLDGVDTKLGRVDGLGAKVVGLDEVVEVTLGLVGSPHVMNLLALDDVIPLGIGSSGGGLRGSAEGLLLERLDGIGHQKGDLVPEALGLGSDLAEEVLERLHPGLGDRASRADDGLLGISIERLLVLERSHGGGRAQGDSGREPHDDGLCS